jgi:hypothetical protein
MFNNQNQLIHNFIPCKNSSNIAGLYDTIEGTFYSSDNHNYEFIAGEAI